VHLKRGIVSDFRLMKWGVDMAEASTVVNFPVTVALECPQCGAAGQGSCTCDVPYVPAGERAAKAVAENACLSDRAIAEKIGVSDKTVAKARKASTAELSAVEKRVGRDGKHRAMPEKRDDPKNAASRRIHLRTCHHLSR